MAEPVNEEFLGKILGGIKNLFKKAQERINKTKGGKEIEVIYQKYLGLIHDQLQKAAQVDLNLAAAAKEVADPNAKPEEPAKPAEPAKEETKEDAQKESKSYKIYEAEEAQEAQGAQAAPDPKLAVDTLKKKKTVMDQIVAKYKDMAMKEMDAVLKKFGGAVGNPQLNVILQTKKDQFDLDYLNAQISYLNAAGDKTMVSEISKKRDLIAKGIEQKMQGFEQIKPVDYKEGDEVIYLLKGKKPEEYKKDKKPEEQKSVVGVHKIVKIEGDKFTLEDEDGKPTIIKNATEIMGKSGESAEAVAYKEGDSVMYKRDNWEKNKAEEVWKKLSDDEKKKPDEGKLKELIDNQSIGIKTIKTVEKDFVRFTDVDWVKDNDELLGIVEVKPEGQEDLVKKLGDMKTKKPDDIKKVSNYVDFISDEKNKDKVAEIDKLMGGDEENSGE